MSVKPSIEVAQTLVSELAALPVQDGDLVLVRVSQSITPERARNIAKNVNRVIEELCKDAKVLVLAGDIDIECLGADELRAVGLQRIPDDEGYGAALNNVGDDGDDGE